MDQLTDKFEIGVSEATALYKEFTMHECGVAARAPQVAQGPEPPHDPADH